MRISTTVSELTADLTALGRLGDEAIAAATDRLADAMSGPFAARLVELVSALAAELDASLGDARAEARITGDDVRITVVREESEPAEEPADESGDDADARITLRLSTRLKSRLEAAAAAAGVSVNTYIVRTLSQPEATKPRGSGGHRQLRGYGQS